MTSPNKFTSTKPLKIATRSSPLATYQANFVGKQLSNLYKGLTYELVKVANLPVNHKDSFVKLCEECLAKGEADLAVHSAKDLPINSVGDLEIAAYCRRENPLDVIIFSDEYQQKQAANIDKGGENTPITIGTASPRRQVQLMHHPEKYVVKELRGNVGTRIDKLNDKQNELDAIVLAAAGLIRLQKSQIISRYLTPAEMVPAAGQGALALQCSATRDDVKELVKPLKHKQTELCVIAERHTCQLLEADCDSAVGVYAFFSDELMHIYAMAGDIRNNKILRVFKQLDLATWNEDKAKQAGKQAADELIKQGAKEFIYKK